jgi:ATP-dependent DNA ligase
VIYQAVGEQGHGTIVAVGLPVEPPLLPMLAKAVPTLPDPASIDGGLAFEPKWDGFRGVVFRDGDQLEIYSRPRDKKRGPRPLGRYFPEVVAALLANTPARCVLDGEIVLAVDGRLNFTMLQQRLHPAKSRVDMLATTVPARYVAFDLLAHQDASFMDAPFEQRRRSLQSALADATAPVHLTPLTTSAEQARLWFDRVEGAGLDGVVAKPLTGRYEPDRRAMLKVKHARTADVVVAGYRLHKASTPERPLLGSLLLGLYDADGTLQHVGVAASFPMTRRAELHDELQPLVAPLESHPWGAWAAAGEEQRRPGNTSRWNVGKDLSFVPLSPTLVCEVGYDAMEGSRLRHTAQLRRWRPDRDPLSCTYDQLERPVTIPLDDVLRGDVGAGA